MGDNAWSGGLGMPDTSTSEVIIDILIRPPAGVVFGPAIKSSLFAGSNRLREEDERRYRFKEARQACDWRRQGCECRKNGVY